MEIPVWYMLILCQASVITCVMQSPARKDLLYNGTMRSKVNMNRSLLNQGTDLFLQDQEIKPERLQTGITPFNVTRQDITNKYQEFTTSESEVLNNSDQIPDFCWCSEVMSEMSCNCTARSYEDHWPLKDILELLPRNISRIYMSKFKFGILQNNTFEKFRRLYDITIIKSNLSAIDINAFKHFSGMQRTNIILHNNDIQYIKPGVFRYGKYIHVLDLHNNYNLGLKNVQNILRDLEKKIISELWLAACGFVIDKIDGAFFKSLKSSNLKLLHLEGNTIKMLEPDAFIPVKSLTNLWISNFMYVETSTFDVLSNLREFRLFGGIQISTKAIKLTIDLNKLKKLQTLFLFMSYGATVNLKINQLTQLKHLKLINAKDFASYRDEVLGILNKSKSLYSTDLSRNLLFQYTDHELCQMFQNKSLVDLRLEGNYFTHLPICIFRGMFKLKVLSLENNKIITIQKDLLKDLVRLKRLDLSANQIMFIDHSNFVSSRLIKLRRLYIDHNNLGCTCELNSFRDILKARLKGPSGTTVQIKTYRFTRCSTPEFRKNEFVHNYTTTWMECNSRRLFMSSSLTGATIILLAILTATLLKYFWRDIQYIKMVRKARKHQGYVQIQDEVAIKDDAFVSYHSEKRLWVERDLCRELENGDDIKFTLMYDERIMPGGSIFTSLGNAINSCRKILFVVSRGWVAAAMNQFEVDMVLVKMLDDHRDMIIVLLMEHIPKAEMPDKLRMMVKHNTCLRWSDNERKQAKFWRDLKLELGKHHLDDT